MILEMQEMKLEDLLLPITDARLINADTLGNVPLEKAKV